MARSDPRDPLPPPMDPRLTGTLTDAIRLISDSLAGYTHDLGRLAAGYQNLEESLTRLTHTVEQLSSSSPGLVMAQELLRRDLTQAMQDLNELRQHTVRIDPDAKVRGEWWRWGLGLASVVFLGMMSWAVGGWQRTAQEFALFRDKTTWVNDDQEKHLQRLDQRLQALEQWRYLGKMPPGER